VACGVMAVNERCGFRLSCVRLLPEGVSSSAKALHVLVRGVDAMEAEQQGLGRVVESHLAAMWGRVIKPAALAESEMSEVLDVRVVFVPSPRYVPDAHAAVLTGVKTALDEQVGVVGGAGPGGWASGKG
jgi:hypothetical protein